MSELTLVVGSKNLSSWSLRPWLALMHTGQPFREVPVELDTPHTAADIARWSPSGRVPVLHHGSLVIWDSLAICEYLAETFPEAGLWPESREARAVARSVCAEMHSGFTTVRQHMPFEVRAHKPGEGRAPGVSHDIARMTTLWKECRARFGEGGPFLFGAFSIADAFYAPVAVRFATYEVTLEDTCRAWSSAVLGLPAMRTWLEAARKGP